MANNLALIIKPTHECNLGCKYCYIEKGAETGRMSSLTLENMIYQLSLLPEKESFEFIWHGGEPLLMGVEFYKQAFELQKKYLSDKKVNNGLQTNATLITEEILSFCEDFKFSIGSSLDGPKKINDLTRVYKDGKGSFDDIWRGIQLIKERNEHISERMQKGQSPFYLGGGAITVLTKYNIDQLEEVYDFFKTNNMGMKINPLIKSGKANEAYGDMGLGPEEYGKALVILFDKWFNEVERGIDIDPLSSILGSLMTGMPTSCNFGENCRNKFVSIGPLGDVYPCGRFDGVKDFWMGNLNQTPLSEILSSRLNNTLLCRNADSISECSSCKNKKICNAGCMHNAYMQKGDIRDKDYYCASYKILFSHLENALNSELDKAKLTPEEVKNYKEEIAKKTKFINKTFP